MSHQSQPPHVCQYSERIDRMCRQVDEMHSKLFVGNGQPSLMVRVDRLEQSEDRRVWLQRTVVGAALGSVVASLWALFGGRGQ